MNWIENCYRGLFLDFHNNELVNGIASEFDASNWAGQLNDAGIQCVNVFTNDMFGWKYYLKGEKGFVHPHLPRGLDMVEETVRECHLKNIKVLAYYAPQRPAFFRETHPEYLVRDAGGVMPEKTQNGLCKLGLVAKEELLPQVEEIARFYDVDGIYFDGTYAFRSCYCSHCREAYQNEAGFDIPVDQNSHEYKLYIKWLLDMHTKYKKAMIDAAHWGNPDIKVMDNWAYTYRLSEEIPEQLDALKCDIEPANQVFHASLTARSFAQTGKPFFIQNTGFLKWWGEWGIKPVTTLKQEFATILANGGRVFPGYQLYPQFKVESAVMDTFKQAFEFVKVREDICNDSKVVPYIGVFYSTVNRGVTHGAEVWPDLKAVFGIHKLLIDSGLHYNMLSDQNIARDIGKFKAVIISDMRYIRDDTAIALREYVRNGGSLIVTGLSGILDESFNDTGRSSIEDLLGVEFVGHHPDSHAYMVLTDESITPGTLDMPLLVETEFAYVRPVAAKVLATLKGLMKRSDGAYLLRYSPPGDDTGYPSITLNEYGKGKAVYIAGDIFLGYYTGAQWNLVNLIKNILYNHLLEEKLVEVLGPSTVEAVLCEKKGKKLVHLVNTTCEMPAFGTSDISCVTREAIPVHDLRVRVFMKEIPSRVTVLPGNTEPNWFKDGDYVCIDIDKLEIHSCIEIE